MNKIVCYSKKTFRALKSQTCLVVNENAIDEIQKEDAYYLGVKDTNVITQSMIGDLRSIGFIKHTIDKSSKNGRAIDITLQNPITGRMMSGSSSGSAINVFLEVNDIAIATDGGGSVLAPALSLNLFGFISKKLYELEMKQHLKISTDGISFTPSIGFISKEFKLLKKITEYYFSNKTINLEVFISKPKIPFHLSLFESLKQFKNIFELNYYNDRESLINDLSKFDFEKGILITYEGPIDLFGYGDSIIGQYGTYAKELQNSGHKYYLKVLNMMGLTALVMPTQHLSCGYLLICKSEDSYINVMMNVAETLITPRFLLEKNYFGI